MSYSTEKILAKVILKKLKQLTKGKGFWFRVIPGRGAPAGTPDILGTFMGRSVALEVKLPGKEPTSLQVAVLCMMRKAGALAEVIKTVREVPQILQRIEREAKGGKEVRL